jgi:hypothetical protein
MSQLRKMTQLLKMSQPRAVTQAIRPRLFPANPILYNQSFPLAASFLQGETCLAASPQKSRV